jgi:hypothetical protein
MRGTTCSLPTLFMQAQEDELILHRNPGDELLDMGLSEEAAQAGIACAFLFSADLRQAEKTTIRSTTVS